MIFVWRFTILCFQRISIFILEKENNNKNKNKRVNTVPLSLNEGINDCLKWLLTTYKILLCYHSTYLHQVRLWSSQLRTQFCNCVEYPEKVRTSMGLSLWPHDASAMLYQPTELSYIYNFYNNFSSFHDEWINWMKWFMKFIYINHRNILINPQITSSCALSVAS